MVYDAIIIGGGIAGGSIAHALQKQNKNILVLDSATNAASSNARGMIKPWLSLGPSPMREFYHGAYHHTLALLEEFPQSILRRGILQLPKDDGDIERFERAPHACGLDAGHVQFLSASEASLRAGITITTPALFWPLAAVIKPNLWVSALFGAAQIISDTATSIHHDKHWHVKTNNKNYVAQKIFLATGADFSLWENLAPKQAAALRLRKGQITHLPSSALPSAQCAISFGHYWLPGNDGDDHILGATYEQDINLDVTNASHQENLGALMKMQSVMPDLPNISLQDVTHGRSAVRVTTANHMPIMEEIKPNLWVMTGLGSRGLMSAPYLAAQKLSV